MQLVQPKPDPCDVSYLVLDYNRPSKVAKLLESIKTFAHHKYRVTLLVNGGAQEEHHKLYAKQDSIIDDLILSRRNFGCGIGTVDLIASCKTTYAIYVQSDQFLGRALSENDIDYWKMILRGTSYKCIDLAGAQAGDSIYSERAQFIKVSDYLDLGPFPAGGPGPFTSHKWTETHVQEHWNNKVIHGHYFVDNGSDSIRQLENGGVFRHEPDTKRLFVVEPVKDYDGYYKDILSEQEWQQVFAGEWPAEGKIPSGWIKDSFVVQGWH